MQSYMTGWYALVRPGPGAGRDRRSWCSAPAAVWGSRRSTSRSALGLHVIAAASTADKRALAESLGAEATIDTSALDAAGVKDAAKDVRRVVPEIGRSSAVSTISTTRSAASSGETCLRALGDDGQYLVIGFVAGIPSLPANQVLLRNRRVTGVDWGAWASRHPDGQSGDARLDPRTDRRAATSRRSSRRSTPWPTHARALADLAGRKVAGKVALVP